MTSVNRSIVVIEDQLHPTIRRNVEEQIRLKVAQLAETDLAKPLAVMPPAETLTDAQQVATETLKEIASENAALDVELEALGKEQTEIAARRKAVRNIRERVGLLKSQIAGATSEIAADMQLLAIAPADIFVFEIKDETLGKIDEDATARVTWLAKRAEEIKALKAGYVERLSLATDALNGPQRIYQDYLVRQKAWQTRAQKYPVLVLPAFGSSAGARVSSMNSLVDRFRSAISALNTGFNS